MKLDQVRSDYRRWGLVRTVFIRVMSVFRRFAHLHCYRLFVRQLESTEAPVDAQPEISLRVARPEELHAAASDPDLELDLEFVHGALARGDTAFGAFDGEQLVAYSWRTCSAAPLADGLWVRVDAPHGYSYNAFTRESHRGKRLAFALMTFSDAHAREWGHTTNVAFVELSNYPSLSLQRAKGGRAIGYVGYANWLGSSLPFRSPGAKTVGLRFFPNETKKAGLTPKIAVSVPSATR